MSPLSPQSTHPKHTRIMSEGLWDTWSSHRTRKLWRIRAYFHWIHPTSLGCIVELTLCSFLSFFATLDHYADPSLQDPKAPRSRIRRSRTCREAPKASRWSWSRWWSTSPQVCRFITWSNISLYLLLFENVSRTNFDKVHTQFLRHFRSQFLQYLFFIRCVELT